MTARCKTLHFAQLERVLLLNLLLERHLKNYSYRGLGIAATDNSEFVEGNW